jgi:hypothetical protein
METTPLRLDPKWYTVAQVARLFGLRGRPRSGLVARDVHPRVAIQILRHSPIAVMMDVYSQVTSESTLRALKALGERLERH